MNSDPYRFLVIAPYEGFGYIFSRTVQNRPEIRADIYSAPLNEVESMLKAIDTEQYEVVICRGQSAKEAARHVSRPVVTVEFSPIDILRGLELASLNHEKKMAFVSFFEMEHIIRLMAEFMNFKASDFIIPPAPQTTGEMDELIVRLHDEEGVELFIGDGACTRCANQHGFEYLLITSGPECLESAISQAIEICETSRALRESNSFFRTMLSECDARVIILSDHGETLHTNLPNTQITAGILHSASSHVSGILQHGRMQWVYRTDTASFKLRGKSISYGGRQYALCTVEDAFDITDQKGSFIKYKEAADVQRDLQLVSATPSLNRLLPDLEKTAPGNTPLIITGSPGTGKISFARAVYARSAQNTSPLVEIDCQGLEKRNLQRLLNEDTSPLFDRDCVIIFKNLDSMPIGFQLRLAETIQSMELNRRHKIISTVNDRLNVLVPANRLSSDLAYELNGYSIHIPELHESPELAVSIARQYLNELNQEMAKQLAGFEPEALELLQNFHWNFGIPQYKLVIKQLALSAAGQFITAEEVRNVLSEIDDSPAPQAASDSGSVSLDGDLESITHQIVMKVLEQEGMNQSQAARRLNVSRMTIWKHMNKSPE